MGCAADRHASDLVSAAVSHGNALETHRTLWTADELRRAGCAILWDGSLDRWGQAMLVAAAGAG